MFFWLDSCAKGMEFCRFLKQFRDLFEPNNCKKSEILLRNCFLFAIFLYIFEKISFMKNLILFGLFMVLSKNVLLSQNNNTNRIEKPEISMTVYAKNNMVITNKETAKVSDYCNLEPRIKERLIDNTIPQGFPKYNPETSKEKYYSLVDIWLSNNGSLVKPEYRNKPITSEK